jgi:hypothetical protein
MCKCVTVLHTTNHFESTILNAVKTPDEDTQGVPKHVGGNFVHPLYIRVYFSARKVVSIRGFRHYAR